jgi:hypothetical protein
VRIAEVVIETLVNCRCSGIVAPAVPAIIRQAYHERIIGKTAPAKRLGGTGFLDTGIAGLDWANPLGRQSRACAVHVVPEDRTVYPAVDAWRFLRFESLQEEAAALTIRLVAHQRGPSDDHLGSPKV